MLIVEMRLVRHARTGLRMQWHQAQLPHQAPDPAYSTVPAQIPQRQLHPPTAVVEMAFMDRRQRLVQHGVRLIVPRCLGSGSTTHGTTPAAHMGA